MKFVKIILLRSVVLASIIYVAIGAYLWVFQRDIIYLTTNRPLTACPLPSGASIWRHNGEFGLVTQDASKHLMIMYHGNGGTACSWRNVGVNYFSYAGYDTLIPEYAGYSGDLRKPKISEMKALVASVQDWAVQQGYESISFTGYSLGGAIAGLHAKISEPEQIFLLAPFDKMINVAHDMMLWYPSFVLRDGYDNIYTFSKTRASVAILHGDMDRVVKPQRSLNLFNQLRAHDVRIERMVVKDVPHNLLFRSPHIDVFFRKYLIRR